MENKMIERNCGKGRVGYIDSLRGFCIILMVLLHIQYMEVNKFSFYAHAYHMPIFFIVSGCFFKPVKCSFNEILSFLRKKAVSLLIPYVFAFVVHYLLWLIVKRNSIEDVLSPLMSFVSFNHDGLPVCQAIWFLTALFFAELIFCFLSFIKNKYVRITLIVIISLLGCVTRKLGLFVMPFSISQAFVGVGLLEIGYVFNNTENKIFEKLKNLNLAVSILLIAVNAVMIFFNSSVNMRIMKYGIIPLFWINCFVSFVAFYNFFKCLDSVKNKPLSIMLNELRYIGKNSIIYLLFNQVVISTLGEVIVKIGFLNGDTFIIKAVYVVVSMDLTMLCLRIASIIFEKTPMRIFVGRKLHDTKI